MYLRVSTEKNARTGLPKPPESWPCLPYDLKLRLTVIAGGGSGMFLGGCSLDRLRVYMKSSAPGRYLSFTWAGHPFG